MRTGKKGSKPQGTLPLMSTLNFKVDWNLMIFFYLGLVKVSEVLFVFYCNETN
jgi:hypothetical protein